MPGVADEHVDHDVNVVEENPPALRATFLMPRPRARRLQGRAHRLDDGVGLRGRARARDEEEIRDARQPLQVQDDEILGVLLEGSPGREPRGG